MKRLILIITLTASTIYANEKDIINAHKEFYGV